MTAKILTKLVKHRVSVFFISVLSVLLLSWRNKVYKHVDTTCADMYAALHVVAEGRTRSVCSASRSINQSISKFLKRPLNRFL